MYVLAEGTREQVRTRLRRFSIFFRISVFLGGCPGKVGGARFQLGNRITKAN